MSRFVRQDDVRTLTLANGDRLTVRARLSAGDARAVFNRKYLPREGGGYELNLLQVRMVHVTAYLLDWSLVDDAGKRVVIRDLSIAQLEAVLDALDPESFAEIHEAILAHALAMQAERETEKKTAPGPMASASISPSLVAVGGATNG